PSESRERSHSVDQQDAHGERKASGDRHQRSAGRTRMRTEKDDRCVRRPVGRAALREADRKRRGRRTSGVLGCPRLEHARSEFVRDVSHPRARARDPATAHLYLRRRRRGQRTGADVGQMSREREPAEVLIAPGDGHDDALTRRALLTGAATAIGAAVVAGVPALAAGQKGQASAPARPASPVPDIPGDPTKVPGAPTSALGTRSRFVDARRTPTGDITGSSLTPHQNLTGSITPADLHFEVHHAGVPLIDPARHTLLIHGLVERPTTFSIDDIKRFPQVTRVHFLECSGNGGRAWRGGTFGGPNPGLTPQFVAGLTSNTEWTGVPLRVLFEEVGPKREATWFLAEGSDACLLARSIPTEKARDDALVVWAQNGEPLRPEQG